MKNKKQKLEGIRKGDLKKKLGEKCVYCKCENQLILTIDHKIPLARGGADNEKNMQICCSICNQLKGALTHVEFKKYLKTLYNLNDLKKLTIVFGSPSIRLNVGAYPLTEGEVLKEIAKETEEKENLKTGVKDGEV